MLGVSLNCVICSTPRRSSPFAMAFLHVRQLARPDFASSITFAIAPRTLRYVRAEMEQAYPVIATRVDPRGDEFRGNDAANRAAVEKLRGALAEATVGGGEKYNSRHKAAGKLLPRERIELLLDRDSYFLELCPLAGKDVPGHAVGASIIGGIGRDRAGAQIGRAHV